jgi:hypothetical protein
MDYLLEKMFSGFFPFIGGLMILGILGRILIELFKSLVYIFRGYPPQDDESQGPAQDE